MARSVVQLWGNLNFGSIALMKNDWASVVLGWVVITGPCGYSFGFAPGLEITLPTHTKGTRPVVLHQRNGSQLPASSALVPRTRLCGDEERLGQRGVGVGGDHRSL